jgi:predicted nucleotidyltransferase component of viral defense system
MIDLQQIENYFPPFVRENPAHRKYLLKEYIQLSILDFLSTTVFVQKMVFIGGTNLRLVKGIDRFSEDLDFDNKNLSQEDFAAMTDAVLKFLQRSGLRVETREKPNSKLKAYRSSIYFPELLFELKLTTYREERFLLKIESQNQEFAYQPKMATVRGCGFLCLFPVPPDDILCAMKISALLTRAKGRDFYDTMFLLAQTQPNYAFLAEKQNIHNWQELKIALEKVTANIDLQHKSKDFEHLLFDPDNTRKILLFNMFLKTF